MKIYAQNLTNLTLIGIAAGVIFTALLYFFRYHGRIIKGICLVLFLLACYGILRYTVIGRIPTNIHEFSFLAPWSNEFFREMFMNALLYYPFGLTLTVLIGPWSILCGFLVSVAIETWQYISGTGLSQGTDVLMNTLGCIIGALPWILVRRLSRESFGK